MTIPIQAALVRELIETRYGSIDQFVVEWEHRVATGQQKAGSPRDRATIYRWLKQGIPSRQDELYGFCAALDVDPLAILPLSHEFIERVFPRERLLLQVNSVTRSQFAPIWLMYRSGHSYPNAEIAERYYNRSWYTFDFSHEPDVVAGVYAAVSMNAISTAPTPRAYHFSYRRTNARDQMWRPYGSVVRLRSKTVLLSESGDFQEDSAERPENTTVAETYFGDGAAEFRVVSLHPFTGSIAAPSMENGAVRFWA